MATSLFPFMPGGTGGGGFGVPGFPWPVGGVVPWIVPGGPIFQAGPGSSGGQGGNQSSGLWSNLDDYILKGATIFANLMNAFRNIGAPFLQANFLDWLKNAISTGMAIGTGAMEYGKTFLEPTFSMLSGYSEPGAQMGFLAGERLFGLMPQYWEDYISNVIPMAQALGRWESPETQLATQGLLQVAQNLGGLGDVASQVFLGGGWNPMTASLFDLGMGAARDPRLQAVGNLGASILGTGGETPWTSAAQAFAIQGLLQGLGNLDLGDQFALSLLSGQGIAPGTEALRALLLEDLAKNPLLSMTQAIGAARSLAGQAALGQARQLAEQAERRGGYGAQTAGSRLGALAEAYDRIAQAQAQAGLQAMLEQQKLGQTRWAGMGDLLSNLLAGERQRLGMGLSFLPQSRSAASSWIGALSGLGSGATRDVLSRLNLAANMASTPSELGARLLGPLGSIAGAQLNYGLGAGRLASDIRGRVGDILQSLYELNLRSGQLGNERFRSIMDAWRSGIGGYQAMFEPATRFYQIGLGGAGDAARIGADLYRGGLQATISPISSIGYLGNQSPWLVGWTAPGGNR